MNKIPKRVFKNLFSKLCCSQCRNDFDLEDIEIKEHRKDLLICHLECKKCGKDFGDVIFNFNHNLNVHYALDVIDGPPPINADDVLDAHEFIKKNL